MKLMLIKESASYDITNAVTRIEWSGSAYAAARQLSFDYINAPFDNFKLPQVSTGDFISFTPDKEEVFYGQIFGSERSSAIGTISYTAYDCMKNLLESTGQYNFKNLPAETIAQMVCADAQIPVRWLYPTGINIASMLCDDMSLYDIIMAAYTKAHLIDGKKYFPMVYKRGFAVYSMEWSVAGFVLSDNVNLTETSIVETLDSIVNKVKIYGQDGQQTGEVENPVSTSKYGIYQAIYKVEEGVDPNQAANNMLSTMPKQEIKISALGDINCLSCYFVTVSDAATGLAGKYWISSDSHVWENGSYTMDLDLKFDAIMETVESSTETEEEGKKP